MAIFYRPMIVYKTTERGNHHGRMGWEYLRDGIAAFEDSQSAAGRLGSFDREEAEKLKADWDDWVKDWIESDGMGADLIETVVIVAETVELD